MVIYDNLIQLKMFLKYAISYYVLIIHKKLISIKLWYVTNSIRKRNLGISLKETIII